MSLIKVQKSKILGVEEFFLHSHSENVILPLK